MEMSISSLSDSEPSEDDLRDHWNGEGSVTFKVLSYDPNAIWERYELEVIEWDGCLGGLDETLGIAYAVNEGILDAGKLHIGVTYTLHEVTVEWTRGDGWTTDDDVDYYVGGVTSYLVLHEWLYAWWWHFIGHRIRNWRNK